MNETSSEKDVSSKMADAVDSCLAIIGHLERERERAFDQLTSTIVSLQAVKKTVQYGDVTSIAEV